MSSNRPEAMNSHPFCGTDCVTWREHTLNANLINFWENKTNSFENYILFNFSYNAICWKVLQFFFHTYIFPYQLKHLWQRNQSRNYCLLENKWLCFCFQNALINQSGKLVSTAWKTLSHNFGRKRKKHLQWIYRSFVTAKRCLKKSF